jgi:predicted Rossmann-fold nucleotide-binding protein
MRPTPVILVDEAYWTSLIRFDLLVEQGFVAREDLALMQFAADGPDAWRRLSGSSDVPGP